MKRYIAYVKKPADMYSKTNKNNNVENFVVFVCFSTRLGWSSQLALFVAMTSSQLVLIVFGVEKAGEHLVLFLVSGFVVS
jgi:hypothetical protein